MVRRFKPRECLAASLFIFLCWMLFIGNLYTRNGLITDAKSHRRSFLLEEEKVSFMVQRRYGNFTLLEEQEDTVKGRSVLDISNLVVDPVHGPEDERGFFFPGRQWLDSDGKPIQAHGGGILYVPETETFYWYGENKNGRTYYPSPDSLARVDLIGISCYSSRDLWLWKNEGVVLKADKLNESSDLYFKNVMERPKVIYNEMTSRYVMWLHIDNSSYSKASLGVAVSLRPEGPFQYLGSKQPHAFESRDMTVFKDDDGSAYVIYSSEDNSALHITPLRDDYLEFRNVMSRVFVDRHREAPAVFKHQGIYYMITSDCTGWEPNLALVHAAQGILGPWETSGTLCVGGSKWFRSRTFLSQGTFVLPLPGLRNTFLFMADRWNATDLRSSTYVWLPLTMDGPVDEPLGDSFEFPFWLRVSVRWYSRWKLPLGWGAGGESDAYRR